MDALAEAERQLDLGRVHVALGEGGRARRRFRRGLDLVRGTDAPVEAALAVELARIAWTQSFHEGSLELAREAAAVAQRADAHVAGAQLALGVALFTAGSEECVACFRTARRRARREGDPDRELDASMLVGTALHAFAHGRAALRAAEATRARAAELGKRRWALEASWHCARERCFVLGDYARGIPELVQIARARALGPNPAQVRVDLALAHAQVGRIDEARDALRRARRLADFEYAQSLVEWCAIEVELSANRPERALAAAEAVQVVAQPMHALVECARSRALYLLGEAEARPAPPGLPITRGADLALEAFALLADGKRAAAARRFADAAAGWRDCVLYHELEFRLVAADVGGDERRLRAAEARAARVGLQPLVARARKLIDGAERGGRKRRGLVASPRVTELTKREREILQLVGAGLSSADIGGRLGIGRATVETHIRSAMAKLGASRRLEAARLVRGEPPRAGTQLPRDEAELLHLLARGRSVRAAAEELRLSRRTATRRLTSARERLGVTTNAEAVAHFVDDGRRRRA